MSVETQKNHQSRAWLPVISLIFLLAAFLMLTFVGCAQETEQEKPLQSSAERTLVPAASDDLRVYSFDPNSIQYVVEEEGKKKFQVFVRVDYPKNSGTVAAEEQVWEVRLSDLKYMVVDSRLLDSNGELCPT